MLQIRGHCNLFEDTKAYSSLIMKQLLIRLRALLLFGFLLSCRQEPVKFFSAVPSTITHIGFRNDIKEDVDFNILTYEYLYNGGGVAVGDFNRDGRADLYFTGSMTPDKLYLNKGDWVFEDVTEKAGVAGRERWKTGAVVADVNGDGWADIYVCYSGPGTDEARKNQLFINEGLKNGVPHFSDSAAAYGLDAPGTYSTTATFFDYDNDGDLDMFLVNHADKFFNPYYNTNKLRETRNERYGNRLYRNDNGHFTDVSTTAHVDGSALNFGLSVSVSDVNGDGWPDIYVTNDYDERDFLYLNKKDGSFREVAAQATGHMSEFAMGSDIADFNNDDLPDIMELDMLPEDNHRQKLLRGANGYDKYTMRAQHGFHFQQMRNNLQLNRGVDSTGMPVFSEIGQFAGVAATDWSWAPLFADFDNDGWKDLFISNGILKDMTNLDFVKYTSGYSADYQEKNTDKKTMWQLVREMPSTLLSNYLYRNTGNLGFENVTAGWGLDRKAVSNGAVYADLDNDGDLDLVTNVLDGDAILYKNNGPAGGKKAHWLKIQFNGTGKNTAGIGAKVFIEAAKGKQFQEQYVNKGFQSSVDPVMHIGLGEDSVVAVRVEWPGGAVTTLAAVPADSLLVLDESKAVKTKTNPVTPEKPETVFMDVTAASGIRFTDKPSASVDFKISPLLPYQTSQTGPSISIGDANGDGRDDLFVGAGAHQGSVLYLRRPDGGFDRAAEQPWNADTAYCTTDALFFDADGDGDKDLYLVSGGTEYPQGNKYYQDRIFANDGKGHFTLVEGALPAETVSGSCVRAADEGRRGLPDLFVGGRFNPGLFPKAPPSFFLRNVSTRQQIRFEKDKTQTDTSLFNPGMVTDAVWTDLNRDGWPDLVVAGEFMPVTVFENNQGILSNKTKAYGLDSTYGWWGRVVADDLDGDGFPDLLVGNLGTNTPFKASVKEPVSICYGDFNNDGITDPVLCYYNGGKNYPYFSRDEMFEQLPGLQKKFPRYADYADAQLSDLFSGDQLAAAGTAKVNMLVSVVIWNQGNRKCLLKALPAEIQISKLNGITIGKREGKGNKEILTAGNFFPMRSQWGPMDAGIGSLLETEGKGRTIRVLPRPHGLMIRGDVRNMVRIGSDADEEWIVAKAGAAIQVWRRSGP